MIYFRKNEKIARIFIFISFKSSTISKGMVSIFFSFSPFKYVLFTNVFQYRDHILTVSVLGCGSKLNSIEDVNKKKQSRKIDKKERERECNDDDNRVNDDEDVGREKKCV